MATKKKSTAAKKNTPPTIGWKFGWHWLPEDMKLRYDDGRKAEVGKTLISNGKPAICSSGLHASENVADAASFGLGTVLCRVQVWGQLDLSEKNKFCGSHRKVLWAKKLTFTDFSHLFLSVMAPPSGGAIRRTAFSGNRAILNELSSLCQGSLKDKTAKWLEDWAKNNGCNDNLANKVLPTDPYTKPAITIKVIHGLLMPRVIRTLTEIKRDLGSFYDMDDFDDIVNELYYDDNVVVVDDFTRSGENGYVLRPRKH
jgi:hypothetical protein